MDFQAVNDIDRSILGVFNDNHSLFVDTLMVTLTSGLTWVPLYVALLFLVMKNNETMEQVFMVVAGCALCFCMTELITEGIVKPTFARPRPGSDPEWMQVVHVVNDRRGTDYSFFSAHASNTFGISMFFCLLVRNRVLSLLMISWALVNCYTRLYLAMHYPTDILMGIIFGSVVGIFAYFFYWLATRKINRGQHYISSQYTSTGYNVSDVDVVASVLVASYALAIIYSLLMQG